MTYLLSIVVVVVWLLLYGWVIPPVLNERQRTSWWPTSRLIVVDVVHLHRTRSPIWKENPQRSIGAKRQRLFHLFLSDCCPPNPFRDFQWLRSANDAVSVRHGLVIDKSCVHGNRLNSRNSMASRSSRSKCIASAHAETTKFQKLQKQKHETKMNRRGFVVLFRINGRTDGRATRWSTPVESSGTTMKSQWHHKRWFIPPGDEKTQMKSIRSVGVKLGTKRTHFVAFSRPPPNQKKIWALLFCF